MTNDYRYHNANPSKIKAKDCVCKAINIATGLKYEAVNNLLDLTAYINDCDKLCVNCYDNLLTRTLCYQRVDNHYRNTVRDICKFYPDNTLIIRIKGHLTCSINGTICDIWDCNDDFVDCYWIIK